jgi:WD40-like Beta Propeller Repeat
MSGSSWALLCLSCFLPLAQGNAALPAPAQNAAAPASPGPTPQIFAPGVISGPGNDGSPTFSPDGHTLFFTRSTSHWTIILESHQVQGKWSTPMVASFSGEWPESSPAMSPDGVYIVFQTLRRAAAGPVSELWRVDRARAGWGTPARLPDTVNISSSVWKPSIAADGTLYFTNIGQDGSKRLFSSKYRNGAYETAQPLSFSDGKHQDVDPEIAPDGSFLVFCSAGRLDGAQKIISSSCAGRETDGGRLSRFGILAITRKRTDSAPMTNRISAQITGRSTSAAIASSGFTFRARMSKRKKTLSAWRAGITAIPTSGSFRFHRCSSRLPQRRQARSALPLTGIILVLVEFG